MESPGTSVTVLVPKAPKKTASSNHKMDGSRSAPRRGVAGRHFAAETADSRAYSAHLRDSGCVAGAQRGADVLLLGSDGGPEPGPSCWPSWTRRWPSLPDLRAGA